MFKKDWFWGVVTMIITLIASIGAIGEINAVWFVGIVGVFIAGFVILIERIMAKSFSKYSCAWTLGGAIVATILSLIWI